MSDASNLRCPVCNGTGQTKDGSDGTLIPSIDACAACGGTGCSRASATPVCEDGRSAWYDCRHELEAQELRGETVRLRGWLTKIRDVLVEAGDHMFAEIVDECALASGKTSTGATLSAAASGSSSLADGEPVESAAFSRGYTKAILDYQAHLRHKASETVGVATPEGHERPPRVEAPLAGRSSGEPAVSKRFETDRNAKIVWCHGMMVGGLGDEVRCICSCDDPECMRKLEEKKR